MQPAMQKDVLFDNCLPLAIELTAARSDLATLELLLARLKVQLLDVAADGPRDLPSRHRTLREAIDRRYLLLTPPEQLLFGALSVFAGGFTAEAAAAVADAQLPSLESFVHKNLLSTQPRFMMLETIRERRRSGWSARADPTRYSGGI